MAEVRSDKIFKLGQTRVYTSEDLVAKDDWTPQPHLYCDNWRHIAGPDIGGGTLSFQYGTFAIREKDLFTRAVVTGDVTKLDIVRQYCKIEVLDGDAKDDTESATPLKTYFGRIEAVEDMSFARDFGYSSSGTQIFTVYDLKVLLQDVILRKTVIQLEDDETLEIDQALGFNVSPVGHRRHHGNLTSDNTDKTFSWLPSPEDVSEEDYDEPIPWTARLAVQYLIENDVPKDKDGNIPILWEFANGEAVQWYDIAVQREGRTSLDVLNELIDRRRMVGYWLDVTDDPEFTITIRAFTFAADDISMPGGFDLPANSDTTTLVAQTSPVTDEIVLGELATHQADKVRVEGEPATITLTLKYGDAESDKHLVNGWTDTLETEYVAASGTDEDENTIFRLQDKYDDVFSRFILSDVWVQKYVRVSDDQEFYACIPLADIPDDVEDADLEDLFKVGGSSEAGKWWHRGHRFLQYLATIDEDTKQYRPMFVLFQDATDTDKYHFAEKLNASGTDYDFACHVYTLPDRPGVKVKVAKQGGQQLIASEAWEGAGATPGELDPTEATSVSYEDMLVTGTMEYDERCYVEQVINETAQTLREIVIRVPDARLDIEAPGCVTDVDQNGELVESNGKVLRDDRGRLSDTLTAAVEWYGTPRRAARLSYSDSAPILGVGQFITELEIGPSTQAINTPVTGLAFDFVNGRCTVETSYAEADFT